METLTGERSTWAEKFLSQIALFEKCSRQDLLSLALHLRKQIYKKGDTVLFQGIISNQLFLVAAGSVSVFSRKDKVTRFLANLGRGDFFGEISLVKKCAATATIKAAVDETEIYTLEHETIEKIIEDLPTVKADLEAKIRDRNRTRLEAFEKQQDPPPSAAPAPTSSPQASLS